MKYDAVIVGSGTGGYPGAVYLAQQGLRVAIIEERLIGGECTNWGCVPSKALYQIAEAVKTVEKVNGQVSYKWEDVVEWARAIVGETREGIKYLLETSGVDILEGRASLKNPKSIIIHKDGEKREVEADRLILALGTDPSQLPHVRFDGEGIVSNREALFLKEKPSSVLIIGGGVIGVEMANVFSKNHVDVTVVEIMEHILPFTDKDVALALKTYLASNGVKIREKTSVESVEREGRQYKVKLSTGEVVTADKVLVATGRTPKTKDIGLAENGIRLDSKGYIVVNEEGRTSVENVFATGDVIGGPQLAHKAILESIAVAKRIAGKPSFKIDYRLVPITIFTGLEIASIGYTEKELASLKIKYNKVKLPIYYLSSVKIKGGKNAFVKLLMDEKFEKTYGIQVVSPNASEVISAYLPLYLGKISLSDIASLPYPHLTVSESLRDIVEYILGEPVHFIKK
ncbi:MAG: dihydrolipoyl dehydrogenase [Thermosphaera sp.]